MEFKNCVPDRVMVYLNEHKVASLTEAATLADGFILTHRTEFTPTPLPHKLHSHPVVPSPVSALSPPHVEKRESFYCHEVGHIISVYPVLKYEDSSCSQKGAYCCLSQQHFVVIPWFEPAFRPIVFTGSVALSETDPFYTGCVSTAVWLRCIPILS